MEFFRNILWSDKFTGRQVPNRKFETYWAREKDPQYNEVILTQKQKGRFSVYFWGVSHFREEHD